MRQATYNGCFYVIFDPGLSVMGMVSEHALIYVMTNAIDKHLEVFN